MEIGRVRYRFARFEFDPASGELRDVATGDVRRVPPQPAALLSLLLERRGALVPRDEIRERLWADTAVEFESSLHFCVREVRAAVAVVADEDGYVENLPRRGYRIRGKVERVDDGIVSLAARHTLVWGVGGVALAAALWIAGAGVRVDAHAHAHAHAGSASPARARIAVMPFAPPDGVDVVGDPRGIADRVVLDLARDPAWEVVGPRTTGAYESDLGVVRRMTEELDLDWVVNGRYLTAESAGGASRLFIEVIRASDGAHVWVEDFPDLRDPAGIAARIVAGVAEDRGGGTPGL